MSRPAVQVERVWKKFHRGEFHDSLRDLIPAIARRIMRRGPAPDELAAGDFWAVRDVSFTVEPGESLGIIGPNGSGKSTLLKILSRILRPNRGRFAVRGKLRALIEVAAGFHTDLTGRENIYLNGAILGMRKAEIDRKFDDIVAFSGIEPFIDTPVKRYSSGMQARLGFAVAAHLEPDVLLVDEVLAVGDAVFQEKCLERMQQIAQQGAAIIFISHDLKAVTNLCTKCLLLRQGQRVAYGETNDVVAQYTTQCHEEHDRPSENANCRLVRTSVSGPSGGNQMAFRSGDPARIEIEIEARRDLPQASIEIYLHDRSNQLVFRASTLQLGFPPCDVAAGERLTAAFDLNVNLQAGVFGLGVGVRRIEHALNYFHQAWLMPWQISQSDGASGICYLNCQATRCEVTPADAVRSGAIG
ncbi:MAG: ABC transporter ATP-binding protein [Pirellulales bacterium]